MISRRYLRIKVMQAIYAINYNTEEDIVAGEKKLDRSIQQCYELSFYFFSLFPFIKLYVENKLEDRKNKNFPTELDLNPNTKFIQNAVIQQIEDSTILKKKWKEYKINWYQEKDLIAKIFTEISELPEYQTYMQTAETSYKTDKELVLAIIEKVIAPSTLLHWYFEEKNLHWFNDYNDALLLTVQNILYWKPKQEQVPIQAMFKDPEADAAFYKNLYRKTIINGKEYLAIIDAKLDNWEADRIIETDMIIMKMALCEIMEFSEIPIKVTMNEYIDIAKSYGSLKSGTFINGLLDKIAEDLRQAGKINKQGQGLINKSLNQHND